MVFDCGYQILRYGNYECSGCVSRKGGSDQNDAEVGRKRIDWVRGNGWHEEVGMEVDTCSGDELYLQRVKNILIRMRMEIAIFKIRNEKENYGKAEL